MIDQERMAGWVKPRHLLHVHTIEATKQAAQLEFQQTKEQILSHIGAKTLSDPEQVAHLPKEILTLMYLAPPKILDQMVPGFWSGEHARAIHERDPQKFIPHEQLRRSMQFAGEANYEGLVAKFCATSYDRDANCSSKS